MSPFRRLEFDAFFLIVRSLLDDLPDGDIRDDTESHPPHARLIDEQRDETGHDYTRHFTSFPGPIAPVAAPACEQVEVPVMFQTIIYDGLIGDEFLRQFTVTFDLPRARMILGPPR